MSSCCDKKQGKRIKEWGTKAETSNTKRKLAGLFKKQNKADRSN